MSDLIATIKSVFGAVVGALSFWKKWKSEEYQKTLLGCEEKVKLYADNQKRKDLHARFYHRDVLKMQIVPHDDIIDKVLLSMKEKGLAREVIGLFDNWEIAPFAETPANVWNKPF
jgi:hypothetical protein